MFGVFKKLLYKRLKNKLVLYNCLVITGSIILLIVSFFVLSLLGIFAVIGFMHYKRFDPAWNLEMGWMAIILLTVPAAALVSSGLFLILLIKNMKVRREI